MSELEPLVIGDLVVEEPTTQGGMGVGISLHKLTGAVIKTDSMGIMSAAQIGFRKSDPITDFVEANVRSIRREMRLAREIAPQDAIGFNIMVTIKHYDMWAKEAVKAGADIIISGAGLPVSLPEYAEATYAKTKEKLARRIKLTPVVLFAKSAVVICKIWDRRCHIALDLVVAEGPLAGGHLGFSLDQLSAYGIDTTGVPATYDRDAYDREVKTIMKVMEECGDRYDRRISATMTGGIYTHEDVMHQLEPGADNVQVVIRFVTAEERDASDAYRQAYTNAGKEDIVITQSPVGIPRRTILNPFLSRIKGGSRPAVRFCFQCLERRDIRTVPCYITMALVNTAERDTDHGLLFYESNAHRTERIGTVDNVMKESTGELA